MKVPKLVQMAIDISRALWGAFRGFELSYYPRREKTADKIHSKEAINTIRSAFKNFQFERSDIDKIDPKLLVDRAKDSLEEAKKQTEYQDAKAGRLLTIVAFLTAAVGTVFGKFIDLYPLHNVAAPVGVAGHLVPVTYAFFGVYLLLVAAGALVSFHAMSTRFVWPGDSNLAEKSEPESLLFWQQIIRTRPESWGSAFAGDKGALLRNYYVNYTTEAYLIATKVADKLRYLDPGQRLLIASIRVLFGLFVLIIFTFALVTPPQNAVATSCAAGTATPSTPALAGSSVITAAPLLTQATSANEEPSFTAASHAVATPAPIAAPKTNQPLTPGEMSVAHSMSH